MESNNYVAEFSMHQLKCSILRSLYMWMLIFTVTSFLFLKVHRLAELCMHSLGETLVYIPIYLRSLLSSN